VRGVECPVAARKFQHVAIVDTAAWLSARRSEVRRLRLGARLRGDVPIQGTLARYSFAAGMVAAAFLLRSVLMPLTGHAAPFVLLYSAMLATSLYAGVGPAMFSVAISLPVVAAMVAARHHHAAWQIAFQALLFIGNGALIVYLAVLAEWRRRRTREMIELSPDAYLLADVDARLIDVNEAACRLLGYTRAELLGKSGFDLISAEHRTRLMKRPAGRRAPGEVHVVEWIIRRKDGSMLPVEVSSNMLPDGRWQGFMHDISERRRAAGERERLLAHEQLARRAAEAANTQLRESEERFRLTIDDAPIGMALIALDGRYVRVNQVLCEITGFSSDELLTLNAAVLTHPNDRDEDLALGHLLVNGEISRYQREKRYIRKDRTVIDVMVSSSTLRGPDGAPRYFIAQVEDITGRKRAAEALSLSEAKFSGIVSIAADAIISVDAEQHITLFNDGAQQIFGYTQDEAMGMALDRLIPERFREMHGKHFANFVAGEESARPMAARQEIFGLRKNGEEFPAEASISKVAVGSTMFFSVVLHDITYRKNVEAALKVAIAARDDVLGIVAHDLRNPLSTIIMQASMMERPAPEPERRDETPRLVITRSALRMNTLIQDLLDVALVEAGQLKVERVRVSAPDLVREVVEAQAPLAASSKLELRMEVGGDVREVWGDRNRLQRVLENLIGNALKFTTAGGHITVAAALKDRDAVFSVADTGPGMLPEAAEHVFERFWQATSRTSRLGAGLGLAIARGIVEAHEGRIWVESALGRGTTFFFSIPAAPPGPTLQPRPSRQRADRPSGVGH
jgi:PAS domain S-box-containing protein